MLNVSPPRVCGDYNSIKMNNDTTPRMRGLPSIPILSTKTIPPRVCGDYLLSNQLSTSDTTPRMRGLRLSCSASFSTPRYNPAYAGTTLLEALGDQYYKIQPRVCGDYIFTVRASSGSNDTTPRMRGLQKAERRKARLDRYNPAYAGTTCTN